MRAHHKIIVFVVALILALGTCARIWSGSPFPGGESRSSHAPQPARSGGDPSVVVWLLNGDRAAHHRENIRRAARNLLRLGIRPENIFISSEGRRPDSRIPRMNFGVASLQNLTHQLALLRGQMPAGSTLMVYITVHGGPGRGSASTNTY